MKARNFAIGSIVLPCLLLAGCNTTDADKGGLADSHVSAPERDLLDGSDGNNWLGYGRTYGEQHYSPLSDLGTENVSKLGLAWSLDLPPGNAVTVPVEVDGVLYTITGISDVRAVDVVTGKELWTYNLDAGQKAGRKLRQGWGTRGLAYYDGKIYIGTRDGRLVAIDAKKGTLTWSVMTVEKTDGRYITGAPRIIGNKVIIGHGGADSANIRGYVTAYDAETGKQAWRFFIVPGNPADGFEDEAQAMAAKTWSGEWWKFGGGGAAWNAFTYDPDTNTVFVGTGNGAPWNHKIRSEGKGDNLFLSCILALDADTGKYKWHYQINPGDTWDYNASMDMHLADLMIDGKPRKVLLQAPKNGFLYVIDRTNGKLISAEKITKVTWATKIDLKTGRPVETPDARFPDGKTFELWPSVGGAHSSPASAYNPKLGVMYIPLSELGSTLTDKGVQKTNWERTPGYIFDYGLYLGGVDDPQSGHSFTLAVDPVTHKQLWRFPTPGVSGGGLLTTETGLVFQGDMLGQFRAFDGKTGKVLWTFDAQAPIQSAPITYKVKGKQYVSIVAGMGGVGTLFGSDMPFNDYRTQPRRILTFSLDGKQVLPAYTPTKLEAVSDPDFKHDAALEGAGYVLFTQACGGCHGLGAISGGGAPDLRASGIITSAESFEAVVRQGMLMDNGMPRFEEFDDHKLQAIRQYLRSRAADLRKSGGSH